MSVSFSSKYKLQFRAKNCILCFCNNFVKPHVILTKVNNSELLSLWFARWLSVKKWLTHQDHKVQLVPDAAWKRCWASIRGGVLELHPDEKSCENRSRRHSSIGWSDWSAVTLIVAISLEIMPSLFC